MAGRLANWKLVVVAVAVVTALSIWSASAQVEEKLEFVESAGEGAATVSIKSEETTGSLVIAVRNASSYAGELTIDFIPNSVPESEPPDTDPSQITLTLIDSLNATPNGVSSTVVEFAWGDAEPGTLAGTLVVSGAGANPPLAATLPVVISKAPDVEPANWAEVNADPETTTMVVTNRVPSMIDSMSERWILGLSGAALLVLVAFRKPLGHIVKLDETDFGSGLPGCKHPHDADASSGLSAPGGTFSKLLGHSFVYVPLLVGVSLIAAAFVPDDATFRRTGDKEEVRLYDINQPAVDQLSADPRSDAVLHDTHGEQATVVLNQSTAGASFREGSPFYTASVRLDDASGPGSFAGSIRTQPDDPKSALVKVSLIVRDWWYWPLLAALFGTWIGWLITNGYDQRRSREMIRKTLRETEESYLAAKQSIDSDSCFGKLLECQSKPSRSEEQALVHRLAQIKARINTATNKESLDAAATSAVEMQHIVALWPELCRVGSNLATLRDSVTDALEGVDTRVVALQPLLATCDRLLDAYDRPPGSTPGGEPPDAAPLVLATAADIEQRVSEISSVSDALLAMLRAIQLTQVADIYFRQFATNKPELDPKLLLIARLTSAVDLGSANALATSVLDNFDAIMDETGEENQLLGALSRYLSGRIVTTDQAILAFFTNRMSPDDPRLPVLQRYSLSTPHLFALQDLRTSDLLTVEQRRLIEQLLTHRMTDATSSEIAALIEAGKEWLQDHHRLALASFNGDWQQMNDDRQVLENIIAPPPSPPGTTAAPGSSVETYLRPETTSSERAPVFETILGEIGSLSPSLGSALPKLLLPGKSPQLLSSAQMVSRIRTTDMLISGATIMLGAIIWLLKDYGENAAFGRPAQYLGVIATTTAISTILGNAILPWARSYALKSPSAASAQSTDAASTSAL